MAQHPDCPFSARDCRVTRRTWIEGQAVTWVPIYDGAGALINSDPNTHVTEYTCTICDGVWGETRTGEVVTPYVRQPASTLPA